MKTKNAHALVSRQGHALLLVIVFLAVSAIILAGALNWSRSNTFLNERNNQYFRSLAAAEAAVGLAIILAIYRHRETVDLANINLLKG